MKFREGPFSFGAQPMFGWFMTLQNGRYCALHTNIWHRVISAQLGGNRRCSCMCDKHALSTAIHCQVQ